VPQIRPFRALRFAGESVGDLTDVVAPPYDVLSTDDRARLAARHPRNVVRLDAPVDEVRDEADDRYRRAARTLAAWRSDGTLHKDPRAAVYVYEQEYTVPGSDLARTQRGFFGRLRLEPLIAGSGVLPHERTLAAAREDRYRLLRATGVNTSPVVGLYEDESGRAAAILARLAAAKPTVDVCDDDGVRHRLWVVEADGPQADQVAELIAIAAAEPITIADGHHRYETALAFHAEDGSEASAWLLAVIVPTGQEGLTIFPTHRIAQSVGTASGTPIEPPRENLPGPVLYRAGRYELLSGNGFLDPEVVERIAPEGVTYTPSREEAVATVDRGEAEAAFLLRPTRIEDVWSVARRGEVLPQKSTFFYPKLTSGLLLLPLD